MANFRNGGLDYSFDIFDPEERRLPYQTFYDDSEVAAGPGGIPGGQDTGPGGITGEVPGGVGTGGGDRGGTAPGTGLRDRAGVDPNEKPATPAQLPDESQTTNKGGGGGGAPATTVAPASPYAMPAQSSTRTGSSGMLESVLMGLLGGSKGTSPNRQALLNKLNGLFDRYSATVDANDPAIASATNAYEGNVNRNLDKYRQFAAERAGAEGVGSGAFDSQIANAMMEGGRAVNDKTTGLIRDETLSRRGALSDVLGQSAGLINEDDRNQLQERLAGVDASLKNKGINLDEELGRGRLSLDELLGRLSHEVGMGGVGASYAGVGERAREADQQNQQFYDKFAYDQSRDASQDDDALLRQLLGL